MLGWVGTQNYIEKSLPAELFSKALPYCFTVQLCRNNFTVKLIDNIGAISFVHVVSAVHNLNTFSPIGL